MPPGYRFSAWLVEMLAEALSVTIWATVMSGAGYPTVRDIVAITLEVLIFFALSGYMTTTFVMRLALHGRWSRVYPLIASILFLAHFEVMNLWMPDGLLAPRDRFVFRVFGFGLVLVVATSIAFVLGRIWKRRERQMG